MQACRRPQLHGRGHELLGFLLSLLLLFCSQPAHNLLGAGFPNACVSIILGAAAVAKLAHVLSFSLQQLRTVQCNTVLSCLKTFSMPYELCCLADRDAAVAAGGPRLSQGLRDSSTAQRAFAGGAQVNSMNKACQQHATAQCLERSDTGIELGIQHSQHDSFNRHAVQEYPCRSQQHGEHGMLSEVIQPVFSANTERLRSWLAIHVELAKLLGSNKLELVNSAQAASYTPYSECPQACLNQRHPHCHKLPSRS